MIVTQTRRYLAILAVEANVTELLARGVSIGIDGALEGYWVIFDPAMNVVVSILDNETYHIQYEEVEE